MRIEILNQMAQRTKWLLPIIILVLCGSITIYLCIILIPHVRKIKNTPLKFAKPTTQHCGIIFGKLGTYEVYSPACNEGHVAVFGGSGSGKTSAILIPTLRSWTKSFTSFSIDISGDIEKNLDCPNKLVFDIQSPERSVPYNVFAPIDALPDVNTKNQALKQLAYILMPDDTVYKTNAAALFYRNAGREILLAALIGFYHAGYDFNEICQIIAENSWDSLFNQIEQSHIAKASLHLTSFEGVKDQTISEAKKEVNSIVAEFVDDPNIAALLRRPQVADEPCINCSSPESYNVFVRIGDEQLESNAMLLKLITHQVLHWCSSRPEYQLRPILICLDELASLGYLNLKSALQKYRKRHIRIMLLTQSLADLTDLYGETVEQIILDNLSFIAILKASSQKSQKDFADLFGKHHVSKHSHTKSNTGNSITSIDEEEYKIPPEEFRKLDKKLWLLHPNGEIKLKKNYYFNAKNER